MRIRLIVIMVTLIALQGCKMLNPSIMLKTPKNYEFTEVEDSATFEYGISPNDLIEFRLYTNDGFKLVDITVTGQTGTALSQNIQKTIPYLVEFDGRAKLPLIGRYKLSGMTVREAETALETEYTKYYNKPFVLLNVINRRVIIFPGTGGGAKVLSLKNDNTTLIEAIAQAGGITGSGKAHKIRLIRGDPNNPDVYHIDLSTVEGINQGAMVLQANDIIYVEPVFRFTREILQEITPVVSLLASIISIIGFITIIKGQ